MIKVVSEKPVVLSSDELEQDNQMFFSPVYPNIREFFRDCLITSNLKHSQYAEAKERIDTHYELGGTRISFGGFAPETPAKFH